MAGTHTPTQTWHTTGQYVLTGEFITESISKDLGANAMDNIARLVGTAAGATPQAVRRIATVADLAALKAIASADRADQDYCAIDTANGERVYKFDSAGAGTGDDYAIVTPNAGTGRWHLVNAAPKTSVRRVTALGVKLINETDITYGGRDFATGKASWGIASNGTNYGHVFEQQEFNAGDIITDFYLIGEHSNNADQIDVTVYKVTSTDGGTSTTATSIGTGTKTGVTGAYELNINLTDTTVPEGTTSMSFMVKILHTHNTNVQISKFGLKVTRSYITE